MTDPTLTAVSTESLEAELARRKAAKSDAPRPLAHPDPNALFDKVVALVLHAAHHRFVPTVDDDAMKVVAKAAVEAVYGPGIWEWLRERAK